MLLKVEDLTTRFYTRNGVTTAVDSVSFEVDRGEILGIVGESGSGKSVCCYSLLGLVPMPPGKIESGRAVFDGQDLLAMNQAQLREIRGDDVAMIFQDPMTCLNPFLTIGEQLIEPLVYHRGHSKKEARQKAIDLMTETGIRDAENRFNSYPHEFSGGMRQRVMIAMALITKPKLLIADEPTTALDVTIQAQILELVSELQAKRDLGVIFISHDLAVVRGLADKVVVMKDGKVVEANQTNELFQAPQHDYTKQLLAAVPAGAKLESNQASNDQPLLRVRNLITEFHDRNTGQAFRAVDDVSFDLQQGEILGLVGESGSGKSTIGRSILKLVAARGEVTFDGTELLGLTNAQMRVFRPRMQMIFQDPYASLNPRMTVFDTLAEPLLINGLATKQDVESKVLELMDDVGLQRAAIKKYPHEFSGGQRQRIAIGRAVATKPELIIADEPVSALDVTIQKQILELIEELVEKHHLSMLFISHDLSVVRALCNRVMVIEHGKLVEIEATEILWQQPQQAYTKRLLAAIPSL